MDIMRSLEESIQGWRYVFGSYAGIKAGEVMQNATQVPGVAAPTGIRYIPTGVTVGAGGAVVDPATIDPGTPATVIATIQKSISESAEGWRMGYAHVAGKAREGIEKSIAGWQWGISEAGSKVSESFGNVTSGVGDWFKSTKWQMLLPIIILVFIAVMVAIGYSGLGAPTARIAEREYVKRR